MANKKIPADKAKEIIRNLANPALIEWPTDLFGITSEFRKAVLALGQRVAGHEDKKAVVDATLLVAVQYLEAKFAQDNDALVAFRVAAQAELEAEQAETEEDPQLTLNV